MRHHGGFFSEMTIALFDLARLGRRAWSIDGQHALRSFKDDPAEDLFATIFEKPNKKTRGSRYLGRHRYMHSVYCVLPFKKIVPLTRHWFSPVPEIRMRASNLARKWGVRPEEMIAVNLRGSQKYKEIDPTPVKHWVELVSQLKTANTELTVSVFSDDQDLVDQFIAMADFDVIDFTQNIRTSGGSSILSAFQEALNASEETKNFVAQTWLISQARVVVTHTGNTAYWTSLFRGCHWGLFQFTSNPGQLAFSLLACKKHSMHKGPSLAIQENELLRLARF